MPVVDPANPPAYPGDIDETAVVLEGQLYSPDSPPPFPGDVQFATVVDKVLNKGKAIAAAAGGAAAYELGGLLPDGSVKNWVMGVGIPACAAIAAYLTRNRGTINVLAKDAYDVVHAGRHSL